MLRKKEKVQLDLLSPPEGTARNPNCERCPNWESAEHVCMWGSGPREAKIMVIAEAPGDLEDRTGKHMQGRHGKLLNELLEAAGIDRSHCYFTHVVKCHPPEGRSPSSKEVKECLPYLATEIETVKPEYILTLGATALKALSKKAKITELHGQPFDYRGSTVVPTFSPAAALRDPARLPPMRKDVVKLGHVMQGNMPTEADLHWRVIRSMKDWNEFIEEFKATEVWAGDVETTGLDRFAIEEPSLTVIDHPAINSIQFGLDNGHNWSLPLEVRDSPWRNKQALRQQFMDTLFELAEGKTLVGQNFKFDNLWIEEIYGNKFHLDFDTMLAHHLLDENSPHGLKELASEYCNAPNYDIDLKTKLGLGDLEKFYKYGCFDVFYTRQLYEIFSAKLRKDKYLRRLFYKLVMPAARMMEQVEKEGLHINLKYLAEVKAKLEAQKSSILKRMHKLTGRKKMVNWNSPDQVAELFYEDLGLPILEKTPGGKPSTDESVLLRLQNEHELPKLLMEFRGVDKNLSTYVDGWLSLMHAARLYLSTKLHGTVTGRWASRLHQVPRDPMIRSLIDAPEGWEMVVADYSQIELRLAAMLSGDARLKLVFQTGGDAHAETASGLLGKPPSELTKEERKMAKPVNFGFLYGMGAPKFTIYARDNYGITFTPQQSLSYRKRYFELYNALPAWHERQRRCVRAFGQVVSLSGRVRHLPGINSSEQGARAEAERQGINAPVQGFGSGDLKAMAMVEIHDTFPLTEVQIKGEVHDSIIMWVRKGLLKSHIPRIKAIMEKPKLLLEFGINMTVPLVADFEIGPWGNGVKYES